MAPTEVGVAANKERLTLREYHAARAVEELDQAARCSDKSSRRAHECLAQLHLARAAEAEVYRLDIEGARRVD